MLCEREREMEEEKKNHTLRAEKISSEQKKLLKITDYLSVIIIIDSVYGENALITYHFIAVKIE